MNKIAFIFPGQGSQHVGMAKAFYESFAIAKRILDEANEVLGMDLTGLMFRGPEEKLSSTENTQPALLCASIAALEAFKERVSITPHFFAGHSLGEYTALVAGGSLSYRDGLRLVCLRGIFMKESVSNVEGRMCAVIGLGLDTIKEVCIESSAKGSVVVPANINSPEQVVISGHREAVERAGRLAKDKGAKRVIPLLISVASHSPLMASASARLKVELQKTGFKESCAPVVTNVEASPNSDHFRVPELLSRQLTSPVRWVESVRTMKALGVDCMIEIGPGKVLSGLVKRIDAEISIYNIAEPADIEKVITAIGS
ncbi:MAG: ACP S-malonyltransferase [Deltaproteobacteria bacterium]|nr:ACP S-malonyltransferase [Deltaproteobacteria bacterium]